MQLLARRQLVIHGAKVSSEVFDERGRLVRAGRGYRWGRVADGRDSEVQDV